jgi:hypothetical protein
MTRTQSGTEDTKAASVDRLRRRTVFLFLVSFVSFATSVSLCAARTGRWLMDPRVLALNASRARRRRRYAGAARDWVRPAPR